MDFSQVRGFNYQPSYGAYGMQLWERFDEKIVRKELSWEKSIFPDLIRCACGCAGITGSTISRGVSIKSSAIWMLLKPMT